jgi:hypothetical protein
VGTIKNIRRDFKKETTELITTYKPIGLIDDYSDDPKTKYFLDTKTRNVSIESARKRIENLRKYKGALI